MDCRKCIYAKIDDNDFIDCKKDDDWSTEVSAVYYTAGFDRTRWFNGEVANHCIFYDDGTINTIDAARKQLRMVLTDDFLLNRL